MEMPHERDKHAWRTEILARRAQITPQRRAREAAALAAAVEEVELPEVVCAYVPTSDEPGSIALLDTLRRSARVLVPVTGPPGPLDWAEFTGTDHLRRGRFGLLEPTGSALGPAQIARAGLVLVPALAVDRYGVRLGRGAGYYDRTLAAMRPDARSVAVVRDDELVERLPCEPHDLRMGWALTPGAGMRRLLTPRE
ncbi:5-formyltetrahydrofolate cyclo-ligase [Nocardia callitridis]|uniref:5-formyltetrahydrofolate cyclo-ligase n=1 Tax=Nocardia callitridis TaxID=648753 RepID=A0ABP9JVF3_9NOCA